ncbi:hypothetical protein V5738_14895 [Salinisphaera sp. SPP-AMP-43]|uniref:hypothetical protein n=1 Tax=Salinisphaera sp. SPP-AMP-43 TaxID=3121288 RepID=UPI003C6E1241
MGGSDTPAYRVGVVVTLVVVSFGLAVPSIWLFASHMQIGALTADWPWLYRTGQAIWAHGLPRYDLWSWTHPRQPWVLYQWLFEALSAPLYTTLGRSASVMAVGLLGIAMYVLVPAWYQRRRGVHPLWSCTIGALVLLPVSTNLGLRPMLASNLALLAQFLVVQKLRSRELPFPWAIAAIALIYAFWANTHLGFTLGLLSLLLFAIGDLAHRLSGHRQTSNGPFTQYLGLMAVALLATGVNPYGWTLYAYITELSLKSQMNAHIHELMPPDPSNPYMIVGAVMLGVFVWLLVRYRRIVDIAEASHVVAFSIMALGSMRFVVWAGLFYVLATPVLFQHAGLELTPASIRRALSRLNSAGAQRACLLAFAAVAVAITTVGAPSTAGSARLARCAALRPALTYFDRHYPPDTRWFSSETAGSCARAYIPGRRVFIDTRFDMYPEPFVMRWFHAYQYRRGWRELFQRWRIETVLLPQGAPLIPVLNAAPDYRLRYRDRDALIYDRRPTSTRATGRPRPQSAD